MSVQPIGLPPYAISPILVGTMRRLIVFFFPFLLAVSLGAQPDSMPRKFRRYIIDSLTRLAVQQPKDTQKVRYLTELSLHQFYLSPPTGTATIQQAQDMAQQLNYERGMFRIFITRGQFEEVSKNYSAAITMYMRADSVAKKNNFYAERHEAFTTLLNMYFYRGEYTLAMSVSLAGLKLAQQRNDVAREAGYQNLLGFIYRNMNNPAASEKAYREYLALAEKSGDSLLVASSYTEIAQVYTAKQQLDSSLYYLFKAYDLYTGWYERHRRAYVYYLISQTYKTGGQTDSAYRYATLAITKSRKIPANQYDVARYYIATGELLIAKQDYSNAIAMLDSGLTISKTILHYENMRDAYHFLSIAYAKQGNFETAYGLQEKYTALKDSLLNEKNLQSIADKQAQYELEKKDGEIALMEAKSRAAGRMRTFIIGIVSLVVIIGFLFYNRYRLKQKNEYQLTINRQQNELFQEIVSAQEKERKRIAENLHDSLGSVLSAAKLQLALLNEESGKQNERHHAALSLITQASEELRTISHAIMPASLTRLGLAATLEQLIAGLGPASGIRFTFHAHGLENRLEESVELAMYHITMELINNIVKHAGASEATVQLVRHPEHVNLTVEDNGKGFDRAQAGQKNGIGLANIESRVLFLGGTLEIDSTPGSGTHLSIDIPVKPS